MFDWLKRNKKPREPVRETPRTDEHFAHVAEQAKPAEPFDIASLELGKFSAAEAADVKILEADDANVGALTRLAAVAALQGREAQSMTLLSRAITINPLDADAHLCLGKIHLDHDRNEKAVASLEVAVRHKSNNAEAHYKLGNALKNLGKLSEALACYRNAVLFKASYAEAYNNMGVVHQQRGHRDDAITCYRKAAALNPKLAFAQFNLCLLLLDEASNPQEALDNFEKALALEPEIAGSRLAETYNRLGVLLQSHGKLKEALSCFENAIAVKPDLGEANNNLGMTLSHFGRHEEAIAAFRRAITTDPNLAYAHSNLLFYLSHVANIAPEAVFAEHCAFGDRFEGPFRSQSKSHDNVRDRERKLRVGFVSADLRDHAVAAFVEPIWAELDKQQFEIWVYSNNVYEDAVTQRLKKNTHSWVNVARMSYDAMAARIREDRIDILFDLSGHTADNRLLTFARKPAPIQVTWIGSPNTTGLRSMDYYLADRFSTPPGLLDGLFTEKIVRLPSGVLFQPFGAAPDVNDLPMLSNGTITFGSFNRSDKLAENVVMLWSKVLNSVPGSRLLLGGVSDSAIQAHLANMFSRHGVDDSRLLFFPRTPMAEYLDLHHKVDLILDTFPFGGGTTSCHAAWMGVPVLTLAGKTMASRVGVIINSNLGLNEFIAESEDQFVAKATLWSQQAPELAAIRSELRSRMQASPFRQPPLVTRWLESAMRTMWHRWCDGLQPESFGVDP